MPTVIPAGAPSVASTGGFQKIPAQISSGISRGILEAIHGRNPAKISDTHQTLLESNSQKISPAISLFFWYPSTEPS